MQNEQEHKGYCLKGDFPTVLETQILSFPEVNWKRCYTHPVGSYHSDVAADRFSHLISKGNY